MSTYRALDTILQGAAPPVEPGETVPASYRDLDGTEHPNDFERLVDLGVAEKVQAEKPAPVKRAHKPVVKGE